MIQARAVSPQTVPKRVPSSSRRIVESSAAVAETPAACAASKTIAATALSAPARAAASRTVRRRRAKARSARPQDSSPSPSRRRAGHQTSRRKASAPSASASAAYWTPRAIPRPISVAVPAPPSGDQFGHRLLRRPPGLADREDEAAGDDVAVGGDDPVGGGVAAVGQAGLEVDAELRALAVGVEGVALVDPLALGVVDPDRAEVALDRLVEAEDDRARLPLAPSRRAGARSPSRVACARAALGAQQHRHGHQGGEPRAAG